MVQRGAGALDFLENHGAFRTPAIRLGIEIAVHQVSLDVPDQFAHAGEAAFADDVLRQFTEEAFDKVQPRAACRGEMDVKPRPTRQPDFDLLVFVRAVVVDNEMNVDLLGGLAVDLLEKAQPFDVGVTRLGSADELAVQIVQRREQRDGAVAGP